MFTYAQNANNTGNLLRYEGEWANNQNGFGVWLWRDGARYAGTFRDGKRSGLGVSRFADGRRSEGELENHDFSGYAVRWSSDGRVLSAGVYAGGRLTTPLGPQGR